jgi:hypothetical protein
MYSVGSIMLAALKKKLSLLFTVFFGSNSSPLMAAILDFQPKLKYQHCRGPSTDHSFTIFGSIMFVVSKNIFNSFWSYDGGRLGFFIHI